MLSIAQAARLTGGRERHGRQQDGSELVIRHFHSSWFRRRRCLDAMRALMLLKPEPGHLARQPRLLENIVQITFAPVGSRQAILEPRVRILIPKLSTFCAGGHT